MPVRDKRVQGALRAAIRALAAYSVLLFSRDAAAGQACTLTIRADGMGESWTRELEATREDLASREDVDDCASIRLEPTPSGARMIVVLNDGRSTQRALSDPLDLRPVATALVLLPSTAMPAATTPHSAASDPNRTPARASDSLVVLGPKKGDQPFLDSIPREASQGRTRFDLGGIGGTRWSGAAPAGSVGLFVDFSHSEWVLGANGRWDGYGSLSSSVGYTTQALEIGTEAGRNFRIGGTSLTFLAAPSVVALSQKLKSTPPSVYVATWDPKTGGPIGNITPSARHAMVVRLGGIVRWTVVSQQRLRLFISADGDIDITSDSGNRMPAAFSATGLLPIWSAGLSLGGAVRAWP